MDVVSSSENDWTVSWFENDGAQSFTENVISNEVYYANGVFVADIDGDGAMDVVSAAYGEDKIRWFENECTTCVAPTAAPTTSTAPTAAPTSWLEMTSGAARASASVVGAALAAAACALAVV